MADSKFCNGCQTEKPRDEFGSRKGVRDGLQSRCKACVRAYSQRHYELNREKRSAQAREWYEANKDRRNAQQREWYRENAESQAEQQRAWAAANPGKRAELVRAWRAANPEKDAAQRRAWREANRERLRELGRAAYRRDPERFIERAARRRAQTAGAEVEAVDIAALWTGVCGLCDERMDADISYPDPLSKSLDHIVPLSRGGAHVLTNLQWAHLACNVAKGARLPDDREVA